jgi:hypothetical protein
MQDLVGGDYNRTPGKIQGSDNLVFVGDIWHRIINTVTHGTSLLRTKSNYYGVAFGLCRTKGE